MSHDHAPHTIERHVDVAVVGATAAGLAGALEPARRRWSVAVVDAGGLGAVTVEGSSLAAAREEVRRHGGEILAGRVLEVTRGVDGRFVLGLTGGHRIVARRVLVADASIDPNPPTTAPADADPAVDLGPTAVPDVAVDLDSVAAGRRTGTVLAAELAAEPARRDGAPSGNEADWDHRYSGERIWSGNPNGTLVHELSGVAPGRALDVGAGEGGDALWLAERGWAVTATDISGRALARIAAEARRRGVDLECRQVDANAPDAFPAGAFDLVSAQYASIPRTPDGRAVASLLAAVAPGGTLLVVSHDLEPMRIAIDPRVESRPFDPDAYVRVEDVVAALAAAPGWEIEVNETRPRPAGAATSAHHVDDVVLRARRVAV